MQIVSRLRIYTELMLSPMLNRTGWAVSQTKLLVLHMLALHAAPTTLTLLALCQ